MQPEKRTKILVFSGAGIIAVLMLIAWAVFGGVGKETAVELFVVPSDAKVTIDGEPIKGTKLTITKGQHTFVVSRQNFGTVTQKINTADIARTKIVYLAVYPNNQAGKDYLTAHPDEQLRYERISGAEFSAVQEKIRQYPITAKLPYQTLDYKIDYDIDAKTKEVVFQATLYIPNALEPGTDPYLDKVALLKKEILEFLRSKGLDIKTLPITFTTDAGDKF